MSKLVRNDAGWDPCRRTDFMQVVAQLADQSGLAVGTGEQMAIKWKWVERAEEAQALDEFTDKRVYRDHPFRLQLAEGYVNGPMIRSDVAKAIPGKVDRFTDAHTGMAQQQEDIGGQIIAAEQFLLD